VTEKRTERPRGFRAFLCIRNDVPDERAMQEWLAAHESDDEIRAGCGFRQ
jgi:hypothetical protein